MILSKNNLPVFIYEKEAYSGVRKIADYVRRDISLVFSKKPEAVEISDGLISPEIHSVPAALRIENNHNISVKNDNNTDTVSLVVFGTLGKSPLIDRLAKDNSINLDKIKNKNEVFLFQVHENANISLHNPEAPVNVLFIIGSDKRGTIYGLFHLSKLLGVSPFVDWSDLKPVKRESIELTCAVNMISKEPSVSYRGFFINDEWPAFGNFANKRFGGINAKLYEVIFTMLLRMNGNYLWPAMWVSCFSLDGPGLLSAELADELGVVMGLSHHEPCLRHGEEYSKVRGKGSIYGDAWNFLTNRDGITRFWRDGLKRNGKFENVVTIGMRGERDSEIMGKEATLADNIGLLRDVINTQNELIVEEINADLTKVPRMLALYKEVEPFFFGDENTPGLMGDECLDDVILLLCDDNHGYLRSRPMLERRSNTYASSLKNEPPRTKNTHIAKSRYGLYYHFDYHGEPVSYEWVNSTYLPEVWEELTEAYETGIRDLFIVNVGDLGFNEFALNYFLDFAYDYDTWGINNINGTDEYTRQWFEFNFAGAFELRDDTSSNDGLHNLPHTDSLHNSTHTDNSQVESLHNSIYKTLSDTWTECCRINHKRRPEHMDENVYPAKDFSHALDILNKTGKIISTMDMLEQKCKINKDAFIQLISYQAKASMNLVRLWIYKSFNRFSAERNMYITNFFADRLEETFDIDNKLTEWVHGINNGLYYGMALASHIGFKHWNDEESAYPSVERVRLYNKKGIVAGVEGSDEFTTGNEWTKKKLYMTDINRLCFFIALCGQKDTEYKITCDNENIILSETQGVLTPKSPFKIITLSLHNSASGQLTSSQLTSDQLPASSSSSDKLPSGHILPHNPSKSPGNAISAGIHIISDNSDIEITVNALSDNKIMLEASLYSSIIEAAGDEIVTLKNIGSDTDGIKLFEKESGKKTQVCSDRMTDSCSYASYSFNISEDAIYRMIFKFLPINPRLPDKNIYFGYSINGGKVKKKPLLSSHYMPGVSKDWARGVILHEREADCLIKLNAGENTIQYYPLQTENILLSITLEKVMDAAD